MMVIDFLRGGNHSQSQHRHGILPGRIDPRGLTKQRKKKRWTGEPMWTLHQR